MKTKRSKAKIGVGQKRWSVICSEPEQKLEVLRPDAAGIDCGAEEHYIAVPPDRVRAGEPTVPCSIGGPYPDLFGHLLPA